MSDHRATRFTLSFDVECSAASDATARFRNALVKVKEGLGHPAFTDAAYVSHGLNEEMIPTMAQSIEQNLRIIKSHAA